MVSLLPEVSTIHPFCALRQGICAKTGCVHTKGLNYCSMGNLNSVIYECLLDSANF